MSVSKFSGKNNGNENLTVADGGGLIFLTDEVLDRLNLFKFNRLTCKISKISGI